MGVREWEIVIKGNARERLDRYSSKTLSGICYKLCTVLKQLNALHCCNTGQFIGTMNPMNGEAVVKRYYIQLNCPFTQIILKKRTKGSIDTTEFFRTLSYILEEYF